MRSQMTTACDARVAIGGRLSKYSGLYPGIVEEAWSSLMSGKPLFLVGAFGGAAKAVIQALEGNSVASDELANGMSQAEGVEETLSFARAEGLTTGTFRSSGTHRLIKIPCGSWSSDCLTGEYIRLALIPVVPDCICTCDQ